MKRSLARLSLYSEMAQECLQEVAAHQDLWNVEKRRQEYPGSAHHATKAIFIRWSATWSYNAIFHSLSAVDQPAAKMLPKCEKAAWSIAGHFGGLGRVILALLPPGAGISEHIDEGMYAQHFDRLHLCLQSDDGNMFFAGDQGAHMLPGELWWFDHRAKHSVFNGSQRDRIHLIIDVAPPLTLEGVRG